MATGHVVDDWEALAERLDDVRLGDGDEDVEEEYEEYDEDEWTVSTEEMPAPKQPVDVPVLLCNWTKLTEGRITKDAVLVGLPDELVQEQDELLNKIAGDFEVEAERMFEERLCVHSTVLTWLDDIRIHEEHSGDYFGLVPYPKTLASGTMTLEDAWDELQRPSTFRSVTAIKKLLAKCSRALLWKVLISMELERLAESASEQPKDQVYVGESGGELNVLDKIIAMILDRLPPSVLQTAGDRFQDLAKRHWIIKSIWLQEFGMLPSSGGGPNSETELTLLYNR